MTRELLLSGNDGAGLFARYPSCKDSGVEWLGEVGDILAKVDSLNLKLKMLEETIQL